MIRVALARCIPVPMRQRWCEPHSACQEHGSSTPPRGRCG